jgi:hypothetical protein
MGRLVRPIANMSCDVTSMGAPSDLGIAIGVKINSTMFIIDVNGDKLIAKDDDDLSHEEVASLLRRTVFLCVITSRGPELRDDATVLIEWLCEFIPPAALLWLHGRSVHCLRLLLLLLPWDGYLGSRRST